MNKRSILKDNKAENSTPQSNNSSKLSYEMMSQSNQTPNHSCKNGVCQVTWKPQRPAA